MVRVGTAARRARRSRQHRAPLQPRPLRGRARVRRVRRTAAWRFGSSCCPSTRSGGSRSPATSALDEGLLRRTITERFGVSPSAARVTDVVAGAHRDLSRPRLPRGAHRAAHRGRAPRRADHPHLQHRCGPAAHVVEGELRGERARIAGRRQRRSSAFAAGQPYDRTRIDGADRARTSRTCGGTGTTRRRGSTRCTTRRPTAARRSSWCISTAARASSWPFEGDPVAAQGASRAGPDRARGVGGRRPARRRGARAGRVLPRAGVSRGRRRPTAEIPARTSSTIVFRVTRGPLYRVGRVEISGNAGLPHLRPSRRSSGRARGSRSSNRSSTPTSAPS